VVDLPHGCSPKAEDRKYLFSFVEAKGKAPKKTQIIDYIHKHIADDKRGLCIFRTQWDFEKKIFGQINDGTGVQQSNIDSCLPIESSRILQESIFMLCPSGTTPNSLQLWESIGYGTIPVIFVDTIHLPGINALWKEAVVCSSGSMADIAALPDRLENIAQDKALLERKRHAMRQLWILYGTNFFIYDIHKLFLNLVREDAENKNDSSILSYGRLYAMASVINQHQDLEKYEYSAFILGCSSRAISDPSGFKSRLEVNTDFRNAYRKALSFCKRRYPDSIQRKPVFKDIVLN
jgi:hypothetical protein